MYNLRSKINQVPNMTLDSLLTIIKESSNSIEFADTMTVIESYYHFTPTQFNNGNSINLAGENNGSCKIFAFGQLNNLSEIQTLSCFGAYYHEHVLKNPKGVDHQNIRNFMISGWQGIRFNGTALLEKETL